jgi:hypothetical protein
MIYLFIRQLILFAKKRGKGRLLVANKFEKGGTIHEKGSEKWWGLIGGLLTTLPKLAIEAEEALHEAIKKSAERRRNLPRDEDED